MSCGGGTKTKRGSLYHDNHYPLHFCCRYRHPSDGSVYCVYVRLDSPGRPKPGTERIGVDIDRRFVLPHPRPAGLSAGRAEGNPRPLPKLRLDDIRKRPLLRKLRDGTDTYASKTGGEKTRHSQIYNCLHRLLCIGNSVYTGNGILHSVAGCKRYT